MGKYFGQGSGGITNTSYFGAQNETATGRSPNDEGTTPDPTSGTPQCVEGRPCAGDGDCGAGKCVGRIVDPVTKKVTPGKCSCAGGGGGGGTTDCPEGKGPGTTEGCPCGDEYGTTSGKCAAGYAFVAREPWAKPINGIPYKEGMVGTCECRAARKAWQQTHGQEKGLGEYQWPPELQALYQQLMGRGSELLNREPGIPDDVLNLMFGKNFEKLRGQEAGTREQILGNLSSQGMLGTGTALDALNKTAWNTERGIGDTKRDLSIYESEKELSDLLAQTEGARNIFGTGTGYNQALEAINSGRRGEGMQWMQMMMAWLSQLLNSWAA